MMCTMRILYRSFLTVILIVSIASATPVAASDASHIQQKHPKLFWLSLDGLNQAALKPYLSKLTHPHPKGLHWILSSSSHSNSALNVGNPSITAPSHISTVTCAPAGVHGVFLNSGNWNGERDLSGFAMPLAAETWIQALRKDHKTVAVAAYPSVDGSTADRSADLGIAYDAPVGKVQYVILDPKKVTPVTVPSHQDPNKTYQFKLSLNADGSVGVKSDFNTETLSLAVGKASDSFGFDGRDSTRRRASVSFLNLGSQKSGTVVAVSPMSVMPVTGEGLRAVLDQKNIVWSNLRDYGYVKYENGVAFSLEATRHRREKEFAAVREMLALKTSDAVFMYLEDLDVLLHAWIGVKDVEDQLSSYIAQFDQDLGSLLASLHPDTNLVVMGDHGMTAVQYELNARKLLPPGVGSKVQLRTSGGTMLLYPPGALSSEPSADLDIEAVAESLRNVTVEFDGNRKVFREVFTRNSTQAKALGLATPKSPWIMAFADDGISLLDRLDSPILLSHRKTFSVPEHLRAKYPTPMNSGALVEPSPMGAHGHDANLASMRTYLFMQGPALNTLDLSTVKRSIDVVPHVADKLGWLRPESCR